MPVCLARRRFLPAAWTDAAARCRAAGVPAEHRAYRTKGTNGTNGTKGEIALAEIARVRGPPV